MQKRSISLADVASPGGIPRNVDERKYLKRGNRLSCFVLYCFPPCLPLSPFSFINFFFTVRSGNATVKT